VVICLERGTDVLMLLPLTVSCFSKIQIGFTFLIPAHPGSPGQRAVKWYVCVYVCVYTGWLTTLVTCRVAGEREAGVYECRHTATSSSHDTPGHGDSSSPADTTSICSSDSVNVSVAPPPSQHARGTCHTAVANDSLPRIITITKSLGR